MKDIFGIHLNAEVIKSDYTWVKIEEKTLLNDLEKYSCNGIIDFAIEYTDALISLEKLDTADLPKN